MHRQEIKWMDKENREAILKISDNMEIPQCFSFPCRYSVGDILVEPLESLDVEDIVFHLKKENCIKEMDGIFKYKLVGVMKNIEKGIISVYGFDIHIDQEKIPVDIENGMYVECIVPRIDIW